MKRTDIPASLLADFKNALNITWHDHGTDRRIAEYIASGAAYLCDKAGTRLPFLTDGEPRTLLLEYVRYARDEALDVYEINYRSRIIALRNRFKVRNYVDEAEPNDAD